ncbi:MAG: NAD-dependent epimerase/dehydratase family protein [Chloroflexota bacterium]|nr:MAG: NAD-dependent epimerase/dehydratase family protein [Chloroflexota bacterium]
MRILLTGATGFIGSEIARRLVDRGHEVVGLARPSRDTSGLRAIGASVAVGDITDRQSLDAALPGCDCVVHAAAVYSLWERDPSIYERVNVDGSRNVFEAALAAGTSKVIHISSTVIWGATPDVPITEESRIGTWFPSRYAETKHRADDLAWRLHRERGLPVLTIHPASVIGAGDRKPSGQFAERLVRRSMPAKVYRGSTMTFVHVNDVVETIVRAAEKSDNVGQRYVVGRHQIAVGDMFRLICEVAGVPEPPMTLPDSLTMLSAAVLTWIADRTGREPLLGLSLDQARSLQLGLPVDGSKVERELGIAYTPLRTAVEELVAAIKVRLA